MKADVITVAKKGTGEIIEQAHVGAAPDPDFSRFDPADYDIIRGLAMKPDRTAFLLQGGELVAVPAPTPEQALALARRARYRLLEADSDAYLASRGYHPGWLVKAMEARKLAEELLADPDATAAQKTAAQGAVDRFNELRHWMMHTVRAYFATRAKAIYAAQTPEAVAEVAWDYSTLDASDPLVRLGTEIYPLLDAAGAEAKLAPAAPAPATP